ncbi:T9SS type A sorting domain-containing protein [Fulvivirga lutea]|uniref:T9SS type A sorting domain-containing protein n=1 Tax=Fulvivirga lutea TaxID=2810512 RepID=A0A975A2S5_9BACT|nr:T9SS type A sorting domain-containing protein [Fulvivirga lutea]QSE98862.1 T9SS type A sorting domain-containing protein [Fulvivirga lutea]
MNKLFITAAILFVSHYLQAQCNLSASFISPELTNDDLEGIIFTDESTGFIVGQGYNIYKSIDEGLSWDTLTLSNQDINTIYGLESNILKDSLYAFGSKIVFTKDQFETISIIDAPATVTLFKVKNNSELFIQSNNSKKYLSSDFGSTWNEIPNLDNIYFGDVSFINNSEGFATASNLIYKTTDGGLTWTSIYDAGFSLSEISISNQTIIATGYSSIVTSTDLGVNWSTKSLELTGFSYDLKIIDDKVYLLNYNQDNNYSINLLVSSDIGTTWSKMNSFDNGFNQWANKFQIINDQLFLVGRFGLIAKVDINSFENTVISGGFAPFISSITVSPSGEIKAAGHNGLLIDINNDIKTISYLEEPHQIRDLKYLNNDTIYAMTDKKFLRSYDASETWTTALDVSVDEYFLEFSSKGDNILAVTNKFLYQSDDAGITWNTINPLESLEGSFTLRSCEFVNSANWLLGISGDEGALLQSTNNGSTWSKILSAELSYASFTEIDFVSDQIGYAAGEYDVFYKTVDGGATWSTINFSTTNVIDNIYFESENKGYVLMSDRISQTINGGESWSTIYRGNFSSYFEDLIVVDELIYIVGRGGTILKLSEEVTAQEFDINDTYCLDETLFSQVSVESGFSYSWSLDNQTVANSGMVEVTFDSPGFYNLSLTKASNCGNSSTTTKTFEVLNVTKPETPEIIYEDNLLKTTGDNIEWYFNNELIIDYTQNTLEPVEYGEYFTIDSNQCGSSSSDIFNYTTILSNDNEFAVSVNVYPNPASEKLYLDTRKIKKNDLELQILNQMGQLIYSSKITAEIKEINTLEFANGVYFLLISGSNSVLKFVINK